MFFSSFIEIKSAFCSFVRVLLGGIYKRKPISRPESSDNRRSGNGQIFTTILAGGAQLNIMLIDGKVDGERVQ